MKGSIERRKEGMEEWKKERMEEGGRGEWKKEEGRNC